MNIQVLEQKVQELEHQALTWENELKKLSDEKKSALLNYNSKFIISYRLEHSIATNGQSSGLCFCTQMVDEHLKNKELPDNLRLMFAICRDSEQLVNLCIAPGGKRVVIPEALFNLNSAEQDKLMEITLYYADTNKLGVLPVSLAMSLPRFAGLRHLQQDEFESLPCQVAISLGQKASSEQFLTFIYKNFIVQKTLAAGVLRIAFADDYSALKTRYHLCFDADGDSIYIASSVFDSKLAPLVKSLVQELEIPEGSIKINSKALQQTLAERLSEGWQLAKLRAKLKSELATFGQVVQECQFDIEVNRNIQKSDKILAKLNELKHANTELELASSRIKDNDSKLTNVIKSVNRDFTTLSQVISPLNSEEQQELFNSLKALNRTQQEQTLMKKLERLLGD